MVDDSSNEWVNAFRTKSTYMKTWKPASTPSNRDRLELYALHKQSVHGDAPSSLLPTNNNNNNSADQAKYQAWRRKSGLSSTEAMRLYCQEADRQVRVYGMMTNNSNSNGNNHAALPANAPVSTPAPLANGTTTSSSQPPQPPQPQPPQLRGLAAIPLLCAAASESRHAYLRRLSQTSLAHAWWKRQEPLTATPGTVWAIPEHVLLGIATLVEYVSLVVTTTTAPNTNNQDNAVLTSLVPAPVIQSFWWPWHNALLSAWMVLIIMATAWTAVYELLVTILLGSRRSGHAVPVVWKDQVVATAVMALSLTEPHQPVAARYVGLCLWPYSVMVQLLQHVLPTQVLVRAVVYVVIMSMAAAVGYWWLFVPLATFGGMAVVATVSGGCFALIELAGV